MRRVVRLVARLYPAAWRARYGAEFEALLEDLAPQWGDVWNVAGGAMKMQMTMWTGWKLVAALGLAGAIAMAVAAALVEPVYESSAVMRVTPTAISDAPGFSYDREAAKGMNEAWTKASNPAELAGIIASEGLYPGETVKDGVARMQRSIRITVPRQSGIGVLAMSFRYPDAGKAKRVVMDLTDLIVKGNLSPGGEAPCVLNRGSGPSQSAE